MVVIPMLTLMFHVDIKYAIGASLVSVIATSSGAAAAYVREGYSNIRIGMFLETATTVGALVGAFVALMVSGSSIAVIFGLVLLYSAYLSSRHREARCVAHQGIATGQQAAAQRQLSHATRAWSTTRSPVSLPVTA